MGAVLAEETLAVANPEALPLSVGGGSGDADATALGGMATRKQFNLEFYNYNGSHLGASNNLVLHGLIYMPNAGHGVAETHYGWRRVEEFFLKKIQGPGWRKHGAHNAPRFQ